MVRHLTFPTELDLLGWFLFCFAYFYPTSIVTEMDRRFALEKMVICDVSMQKFNATSLSVPSFNFYFTGHVSTCDLRHFSKFDYHCQFRMIWQCHEFFHYQKHMIASSDLFEWNCNMKIIDGCYSMMQEINKVETIGQHVAISCDCYTSLMLQRQIVLSTKPHGKRTVLRRRVSDRSSKCDKEANILTYILCII